MIVLKANPEMEATFQRLIQTTGERVKWNGDFVIIGNYLILHGESRSLFFNFDNRKVVSNFIELTINEEEVVDIREYPKVQNIINMLLYAFGKWGTVKGIKVEKSESELNLLFVTILKEISVTPEYSWLKFRFLKDGILITYEDVIQLALEEKENPLKEMEESEQEKEGLWHSLVWKKKLMKFSKLSITEEQRNESRIGFNFYMVGYRCPKCSKNLHMIVFPEETPQFIETEEGGVMLARAYTCPECGTFYTPRPELLLSEGDIYELDFEGDQKAYEDYRELLGERGARTTNCHFNEYADVRQQHQAMLEQMHRLLEGLEEEERLQQMEVLRNVSEAELAKLIQAIPTMNDALFDRFNGILEDGFYSEKAIKKNEKAIAENINKRKKRKKSKDKKESEETSASKKDRDDRTSRIEQMGERRELSAEEERKARLREEYERELQKTKEEDVDGSVGDAEREIGRAQNRRDKPARRLRTRDFSKEEKNYISRIEEYDTLSDLQRDKLEDEIETSKDIGEDARDEIRDEFKKQKQKHTFFRLKRKADGAFGKAYRILNSVIKEIEAEELSEEQKEELLPSLKEERQVRGEEEVKEFMTGLAANMERKEYKALAKRLKEYGDIDISVYQEKLDVQRAPLEKEEIQKLVNETNLQNRGAIVELMRRLEDEEFSDRALKPFMDEIMDNLKAIDQRALDRLCTGYEGMNFEEVSKLYQAVVDGNFLPELKDNALEMLSKRLARIKVEECQLLVEKLRRQMKGKIAENARHHFYPAEDILNQREDENGTWVINRALDTYAGSRNMFEYPIFVADTSLNKGGREGMILTPEHLFCSTLLSTHSVPISEIKEIRVSGGLLGKGITIEREDGRKVKVPYAVSNSELKIWGGILTDYIKYLKSRPQSRQLRYLAKERHDTICCYRCGFVYQGSKVCPECGCKSNQ